MDAFFAATAKTQERLFERQILHECLVFNNKAGDKSGFPALDLYSNSYYKEKFFEDRLEHFIRDTLINGVICRVLEHRGVGIYQSELPEGGNNQPIYYSNTDYERITGYEFIADYGDKTVMYRYTDISASDAEKLLTDFEDELVVIHWSDRTSTPVNDVPVELKNGKVLRHCYWGSFLVEHFGQAEYEYYFTFLTGQVIKTQEFLGVMSVPKLSPYSLGLFRFREEAELINHIRQTRDYRESDEIVEKLRADDRTSILYGYRIIDEENKLDYPDLEEGTKRILFEAGLLEKYEKEKLYLYLLGKSDFARSFLTSEYLYAQYDCDECFDYTAIVSGYLKSVEQLLYAISLFSIDKGNKIKYSRGRDVNGNKPKTERIDNVKMVDFNSDNLPCIDTTMGALWHYIEKNQDSLLTVDKQYMNLLIQCLDCYSTECRNSSFHKHNIDKWSRVEYIRSNTFVLYILILAGCRLGGSKQETSMALHEIKNDRLERLYYLIQEKSITRFEFIYYGDIEEFREEVVFIPQESQFPSFNEYGLIKSAFLVFGETSNSRKVLVTQANMPDEIWWEDESGKRTLVR